jgi:predicted MFS family arabinose efflux permease
MPEPAARQTQHLILVLGLGAMASNLATRALDPLVGVLAEEFGASPARVALLATAFALPYALVQPVLGPVGDAIGKRLVIRAALAVLALALAASALAPDLGSLAALRVLAGAAAGGVFPLSIALLGDRVPIERRQVALSRLLVAGLTGSAGGGALSALLEPVIGWRGVLLLCAAVAVVGFVALRERAEADATPASSSHRPNLAEVMQRYRHILGLPAARLLYGAVFLEGTLLFGVFPFLAPVLMARGHGGAAEAGIAIAGFALGGFAFAALAPLLLRRLGQGRMVRLGGAVGAAALSTIALAPSAAVLVLGCVLLGLGFYMMHTSIQTRVTEVAPTARGSAVALHAFSFFLGQSLGPVALGARGTLLGIEATLLFAAAGLAALGWRLGRRGH